MSKTQPEYEPSPPKQERRARYAELWQEDVANLRQLRGYKALAKATGWNPETVKSDIQRMKKEAKKRAQEKAQPPAAPPGASTSATEALAPPSSPPCPPSGGPPSKKDAFKWDQNLDRLGQAAADVAEQMLLGKITCQKCGEELEIPRGHEDIRKWMETFGKLFSAKMRAEHILFIIGNGDLPPPPPEIPESGEISRAELIAIIRDMDRGPDCLLCRRPKKEAIIDVEARSIGEDEDDQKD